MSAKTRFLDEIIRTEGGYVDDPSDSGGETKYGVTKKTARDYGYTGPMRDLTTTTAKRIYSDLYWNKISGDQLAVRSPAIALEVADTAVNCGTHTAGRFLQRALSVLSQTSLAIDGVIGQKTLQAYTEYLDQRAEMGEKVLLRALNGLQAQYYISLAERRPKDKRFVFGWLSHRVT